MSLDVFLSVYGEFLIPSSKEDYLVVEKNVKSKDILDMICFKPRIFIRSKGMLGMLAHICIPRTCEVEAGA